MTIVKANDNCFGHTIILCEYGKKGALSHIRQNWRSQRTSIRVQQCLAHITAVVCIVDVRHHINPRARRRSKGRYGSPPIMELFDGGGWLRFDLQLSSLAISITISTCYNIYSSYLHSLTNRGNTGIAVSR